MEKDLLKRDMNEKNGINRGLHIGIQGRVLLYVLQNERQELVTQLRKCGAPDIVY